MHKISQLHLSTKRQQKKKKSNNTTLQRYRHASHVHTPGHRTTDGVGDERKLQVVDAVAETLKDR